MKRMALFGLAIALAAAPVSAQFVVEAGIDVLNTKGDGNTYVDLSLPADFFCSGSAPFSGRVVLVGVPIATNPEDVLGKTDTIIERAGTTLSGGVGQATAVLRAISLKGTAPITVSGCAGSSLWDVGMVAAASQSPFALTIRRTVSNGGNFDSQVSVNARAVFRQQGSGLTRRATSEIVFSTEGAEWTTAPGSGGITYTDSLQIDADGDGTPETAVPGTSNFHAGWTPSPTPTCTTPPCPVPIPHQAPQHLHWVFPPPKFCTTTTTSPLTANATTGGTTGTVGGVDPSPTPVLACAQKVNQTTTN